MYLPTLNTGNPSIDLSFRIALGTLAMNVVNRSPEGLIPQGGPVIYAGIQYDDPWTRDASFNTWYAGRTLMPETARNTLLSVVDSRNDGFFIRGCYWDAIIWVYAAWQYFCVTGDREFLSLAHDIARDALRRFEGEEFDTADGLFRGGACFQDGISGYPEKFLTAAGGSGIYNCSQTVPPPDYLVKRGVGIPCKALSTNCLYYMAYRSVSAMRRTLGLPEDAGNDRRSNALASAIEARFYDTARRRYRYLLDSDDPNPEREEGLGHAFLLLSGLARGERAERIIEYVHRTPHGLPCVWPTFERYAVCAEKYGRHSGTIWPQVNAAWALALAETGHADEACRELLLQAARTHRDWEFFELYHPETGLPYAGIQEYPGRGICQFYPSNHHQTWAATGYLGMVFGVLFGMRFLPVGIQFEPHLPPEIDEMELTGFRWREATLRIRVKRGTPPESPVFLPVTAGNVELLLFAK